MSARTITVSESDPAPYGQNVNMGPHGLTADEPADMGGNDSGPSPYEFVMAGLGACTNMTLRMYANQKNWPLTHIATQVTHEKVAGDDNLKRDVFTRTITIVGATLTDEQRLRLLEIADRCPVSRTLEGNAIMRTIPA